MTRHAVIRAKHGGGEFEWEETHSQVFLDLKYAVADNVLYKQLDSDYILRVVIDGNACASGAVLEGRSKRDGSEHPWQPIGFCNYRFNSCERDYPEAQQGALATIKAMSELETQLKGRPVVIISGYRHLPDLAREDLEGQLQSRWVRCLGRHDLSIQPGQPERDSCRPRRSPDSVRPRRVRVHYPRRTAATSK